MMNNMKEKMIKTGTTGLAFRYNDGILIAADMRVSAGYVVGKDIDKVHMIAPNIGMAISGLVSDAMALIDLMKSELKLFEYDNGYKPTVKVASSLLGLICHNSFRSMMPFWVQLIVGGVDDNGSHLYSIDPSGAVQEDDYMVIGSGSLFSLSIIEDNWKECMTKDDARELAKRALRISISRDLYTGDGMNLFFITKEGLEREKVKLKSVEE